jgi:putative ABC transport system permease protein
LLIACANVANLLLARASARRRELAIRAALGAGRWRLVRQLLTESLLLAFGGGALGLVLARWGVALLLAISPDTLPRADDIRLDTGVAGFTFLVSLLTGIAFGLLPALQVSRPDLNETLKAGGRSGAGSPHQRFRSFLIVGEVALAFVLLIGAGLLLRSFVQLVGIDPGLDPQRIVTMNIKLPSTKYTSLQTAAFFQHVLERVRTLPGVEAVAAVNPLPLSGAHWSTDFTVDGAPPLPPGQDFTAGIRSISPDYFKTLRIALVKGRMLADIDAATAPPVVIINDALARRYFANEDPLGKRIIHNRAAREIVGVVKDVKHAALDEEAKPEFYLPMAQSPRDFMTLTVRTSGDPSHMIAAVRGQVWAVDKDQPVSDIRTMERLVADSVSPRRFTLLLLGVFALAGLTLAAVGLYGVMSYMVTQRTQEIGIRMALGAQGRDVLRLVIGQGMVLTLTGLALGLAASFALTRVISSLLYAVSPIDPVTFATVSLVLVGVALLANSIPARRATRVDPLTALRYE